MNFSDVSAVKVKLEGELRSLQSELQSIKNEDEPNETSPGNLPDLSDSTNVRPLVYSVDDAERLLSIPIPDQHIENPNAALGPGSGANTLEELKKVGGWCILEVMDLLDTDSEQERKAYQSLASWLRKNDKVRLFYVPLSTLLTLYLLSSSSSS